MTRKSIFLLILAVIVFAACGSSGTSEPEAVFYESFAEEAPAMAPADDAGDFAFAGDAEAISADGTVSNIPQAQAQERLIIRTGDLSIIVEDTEETMTSITSLVEAAGGWVVNSNAYQYNGDAKKGEITVRVPAEAFDSAIEAIKAMAMEVTNESSSGKDVTDEFVDLSSRLTNLEATANRVRNFLDEAKNVEEALAVNIELSRLEGEIEVIKGRMQYLSQSAAFSTLTVRLTPDILSQPIEVGGWRPEGIARDAVEALVSTLQGLVSFLIWFGIYLLPVLLIIGIPIWLFVRFVVRRWRRRRQRTTVPETE